MIKERPPLLKVDLHRESLQTQSSASSGLVLTKRKFFVYESFSGTSISRNAKEVKESPLACWDFAGLLRISSFRDFIKLIWLREYLLLTHNYMIYALIYCRCLLFKFRVYLPIVIIIYYVRILKLFLFKYDV